MVLKLDMSKAYDKVEWIFHNYSDVLCKNPGVTNWFDIPTRGSVRGTPCHLTYFSFVQRAYVLSSLMLKDIKHINEISVAEGAPTLSHLVFADNSFLFCNAHPSDCRRLYERASRQKVYPEKSAACFSPHTDPVIQYLISSMLGVRIVDCHDRYLGLPTIARSSKNQMFKHVRDVL
ncbi:PREDICTED: reverse mRNAase [Prunus dulcis]|uniref:PREDICTED: reverse mRNAase n=1 Tax=Prunus dulcis TaxID=3755 RepID=A0A5E4ESL0_PRUDU|nr:PREDICTED: reverse mRNAase [Prunus dulcis]